MAHVIVPNELVETLDEVLGLKERTHMYLLDINTGKVNGLTLDDAFEELDLWHQLNVWSNGPVAVLDTDIDTTDAIERFRTVFESPAMRRRIATNISPETADIFVRMYEEGPDEHFKTMMVALRETFRPDRLNRGAS